MDNLEVQKIFEAYADINADFNYELLTSGHINQTIKVHNQGKHFILQQINTSVFTHPDSIMQNILLVNKHLKKVHYPHAILEAFPFKNGEYLWEGQWRILNFITESQTFEKALSKEQAFAAAQFLSEFHFYLQNLNATKIKPGLDEFLNFGKRYEQFQKALNQSSEERLQIASDEIKWVNEHLFLLENWLLVADKMPIRIIHADPKISNFLFHNHKSDQINALIDWDTIMTGPVLYDFGDMIRSYTNLKEEDDPKVGKVFSYENYLAIQKGFLSHLQDVLKPLELKHMNTAALVVVYVQTIRFLTDYLNDDLYYHISYAEQNLNRTKNQIHLLNEMMNKIS